MTLPNIQSFITDGNTVSPCKYYQLRLANIDDSAFILSLRTDPELNKHVSTVENILERQINWMKEYKERESKNEEYYFVIESKSGGGEGSCGAVRLYDFQLDSFCWGSWMIRRGTSPSAAIESALSVYEFAFYTLGFNKSHFDVRKDNAKVIRFHEKFGAIKTGEDDDYYYFNFELETYEKVKRRYERFFETNLD